MNPQKTDSTGMELAPINTQEILITDRGIDFANFGGLWTVANMIHKAKWAPDGFDSPHAIAIAIAKGRSVGLDAFTSMESMCIVGGKPMIYGDAPLAICRQHPAWCEEGYDEWFEQDGQRLPGNPTQYTDKTVAVCYTQRTGGKVKRKEFSVADAKTAHLWGKKTKLGADTGWITYPHRMLMFRARGYALRDNFGDALKGLAIREVMDEPETPKVSNVDELRNEIDKRKAKTTHTIRNPAKNEEVPFNPNMGAAVMPEPTIADRAAQLDQELSDLDIARDILKGIYGRIPLKQNPIECLKKASMEDETWISHEHIDSISDVDYLNRIAARLEEFSVAMGAKA